MSSSRSNISAKAMSVVITEDAVTVELSDGRVLSVPSVWYPRVHHGTAEEQKNCRLIGDGEGIHWPDLDEDVSIESMVLGLPSTESQSSLKKWLEKRKARENG